LTGIERDWGEFTIYDLRVTSWQVCGRQKVLQALALTDLDWPCGQTGRTGRKQDWAGFSQRANYFACPFVSVCVRLRPFQGLTQVGMGRMGNRGRMAKIFIFFMCSFLFLSVPFCSFLFLSVLFKDLRKLKWEIEDEEDSLFTQKPKAEWAPS
jgi:hypothetical protein